MRIRSSLLALALTGGALTATGTSASAADSVECDGVLGAVTVKSLVVPEEADCVLVGTTVLDDVKVLEDASLTADRASVGGNLQAQRAESVDVEDSFVRSVFQVEDGGSATISDTEVGADLQLTKNDGAVSVTGSRIGNNLDASENTGGVLVSGNTIRVNLTGQDNRPAPVGGGNVVGGDAEKQFEGFDA